MNCKLKFALPAFVVVMLVFATALPARAQFAGGGFEQMQQFAPLIEMMKQKMGKRRFTMLMQTMGPMMMQMMQNQGAGFGGGFDGNGFDMSSMAGMMNAQTISALIQGFDGHGNHHRRHHRRRK